MAFFNYATKQVTAKIVYYGPGLGGKTTNLKHIFQQTTDASRGEMVSLETNGDRTLFFDLLPLEVGQIAGFTARIQLYTVPGQVFYNKTRELVLKGADGMVFVADSQRPMRSSNIESMDNLRANLVKSDRSLDDVPLVVQYNKRDLNGLLSVEEMNADLNPEGRPWFEASALEGDGVFETLKEVSRLTLLQIATEIEGPGAAAKARPTGPKVERIAVNGHQELSRTLAMTVARGNFDRARRFTVRLEIGDDENRVIESKAFRMEVDRIGQLQGIHFDLDLRTDDS